MVRVRFQTESIYTTLNNFSLAKRHVRQRYPFARFRTEADRIACEFEGNLVAEILLNDGDPGEP